jgi:Periplasmic binding protein
MPRLVSWFTGTRHDEVFMNPRRLLLAGAICLLLVAGCSSGRADSVTSAGGSSGGSGSAAAGCSGVDLQATDTGITADTITVETIADVGSQAVPGMANGSLEAVRGWAALLNESGGLACRKIDVRAFDSKLDPNETRSGMVDACQNAFADVGDFTLAVADMTPLSECTDKSGARTGQPHVTASAPSALVACNPTTFLAQGSNFSCPPGQGERSFTVSTGVGDYVRQEVGGDATGLFQVGYTSPAYLDVVMPQVQEMRAQGLTGDVHGAKGSDPQSAYTPAVQKMKAAGAQFVFNNATFPSFLQLQAEAAAQGASVPHWICQAVCYDQAYPKAAGPLATGVQVVIGQLPFEEADLNPEMKTFLDRVPTHNTFSMSSWLAARLFQKAVESVVATAGPNGLTRASLLDALGKVKDFDAGGMTSPTTPGAHSPGLCSVIMTVTAAGTFERTFPTQPGTLNCGKADTQKFDPVAAFSQGTAP